MTVLSGCAECLGAAQFSTEQAAASPMKISEDAYSARLDALNNKLDALRDALRHANEA